MVIVALLQFTRQWKLAVVVYIVLALGGLVRASDIDVVLDAIRQVESSGGKDARDGDKGKAIGDYQIWEPYWKDAMRILKKDWPYEDARDPLRARMAVKAYVTHYQKSGRYPATPETWARLHNGGPRGVEKLTTKQYWTKVQVEIRRIEHE
jgi:hypothetical protein